MKTLVAGYGSIGKRHVKNILNVSNNEIVVCTSQNKPKISNTDRCSFRSKLQDCLLMNPEIGFVTNVSSAHVDTALEMANSNCHLFIEKPLSNSLKNVERLKTITQKHF